MRRFCMVDVIFLFPAGRDRPSCTGLFSLRRNRALGKLAQIITGKKRLRCGVGGALINHVAQATCDRVLK